MNQFQEMVKTAIAKTIEQGHGSYNGSECLYRCEDGSKCVVGQLISDEVYSPDLEERSADGDEILKAVGDSWNHIFDENGEEAGILMFLQNCHDDAAMFHIDEGISFVEKFKDCIENYVDDGRLPKYCLEFIK